MNEIKTYGCDGIPPYGGFDDYVIIESLENKTRILFRPETFDFIAHQLYDN